MTTFCRTNSLWTAAAIAVAVLCLLSAVQADRQWLFNRNIVQYSRAYPQSDIADIPPKLASLAAHPTFVSTFTYYRTSWDTDDVPYWRPATMQFWWVEKALFGLNHYNDWMWVSVALYLVETASLGLFVFSLTGRSDGALLSSALFGISRALPAPVVQVGLEHLFEVDLSAPAVAVLTSWKDQPDMLADICIFGAMTLTCSRRYYAALACCAAAVCFKESGWLAFPFVLVVLTYRRQINLVPLPVYGLTAAAIGILYWLRKLAGPELLHPVLTRNHHWLERYVYGAGGYVVNHMTADPTVPVLALLLLSIWCLRSRLSTIALVFSAVAVLGVGGFTQASVDHTDVLAALAGFFDPVSDVTVLCQSALAAVWLRIAYLSMREPEVRLPVLFLIFCGALATFQVEGTQVLEPHTLHLARAFQSAAVALAVLAVLQRGPNLRPEL